MPSSDADADPIRALAGERDRLQQEHLKGLSGLSLVRSLAAAVDAGVAALWAEIVGDRSGVALVGLGGYGRGELSPHSDLDLMILHAGAKSLPESSKDLFYRLWDAGFEVGHAVRTVEECMKLARVNFEAETSFLESRPLAGDAELFEKFSSAALRFTRKRGAGFVEDARFAVEARRSKETNASCLLEPNLKDGAGGLRDLHTATWLNLVFGGGEVADEGRAAELLHRTRNHLHYLAKRRQDVLLLDLQEPTALALQWREDEGWSAWDAFMRDLYRSTRSIEHRLSEVFARLERSKRGKRPRARDDAAAKQELITALRDAAGEPETPWLDGKRRAFFGLLSAGDAEVLKEADQTGVLSRYLSEWDLIRNRPQHNVYHRFTVDIHAYQTASHLARLPGRADEPIAAQVVTDVRDRDLLLLAGLLHDLGKGSPDDHSEAGERLSLGIAARIGLDEQRAATLAWLVRHHLLLVDTATRRDIEDENLVVETAAAVGDAERLRMLYALSVADGLGTGPTAWTPWKSTLVAELFNRMLHVLERGELASRDANDLVRLRTAELRRALGERYPEKELESHIRGMSRAYFLAYPTETLIRQHALMAAALPTGEIRTHVARTEQRGVYELTVVAADRPGLFSVVSGALALNGINVVSAQIYTRSDGAALEVFLCAGVLEKVVDDERWRRVFDDVQAGLRDQLPLDALLAEKRRAYSRRPAMAIRRDPRVVVDNAASDFYTVVEVHAADRIGLLYDVTKTLASLGLDIHLAKVATYGEDVVDAFYLWDLDGQKMTDATRISAAERGILAALGG